VISQNSQNSVIQRENRLGGLAECEIGSRQLLDEIWGPIVYNLNWWTLQYACGKVMNIGGQVDF